MPLPAIIDIAETHLFSDGDKMEAAGVPAATIDHLIRLRDIYNHWLSFPSKRDRDMIALIKQRYGIGDSQARVDLKLVKVLLGNLEQTTKQYHRYRFTVMVTRAYDKAEKLNDARSMVAAAAQYAKYQQLDKEDERANVIDKLVPLRLAFTDNPQVIGIRRVPNVREKIKKMKEKYWAEETIDVDFEDIDAQVDDIFRPELNHGGAGETGIS